MRSVRYEWSWGVARSFRINTLHQVGAGPISGMEFPIGVAPSFPRFLREGGATGRIVSDPSSLNPPEN